MKIFLDTEFYEFHPTHMKLTVDGVKYDVADGGNAVQLISIGAVREDGAEFYAENANFNWDHVPDAHWLQDNVRLHLTGGTDAAPPAWIARAFYEFATPDPRNLGLKTRPEFWGYFCDYDWVVLCGLYGRMVDLPSEFPKYCLDLKQEIHRLDVRRDDLPGQDARLAHHALSDARWIKDAYTQLREDWKGFEEGANL